MSKHRRPCPNAPGEFIDIETNKSITEKDAGVGETYSRERKWPATCAAEKPPFKQFHHQGDGACDISVIKKARRQLVKNGYKDDGAFILKHTGRRRILHHFWKEEHNRPLLEFFKRYANRRR